MAQLEELKRLTPQERLARLKELEEARKREIEEARKMLTETVRELEVEAEEKAKIPIDQLRAVDESALQTEEEKELFRVKRFTRTAKRMDTGEEPRGRDTAEKKDEEELEQLVRKERASAAGTRQYGSPLTAVLDEMKQNYQNSQQAVQDAAYILRKTAYDEQMSEEDKWKTYADAKSLVSVLEETGAPSRDVQYAANAVQKFVDRMKMQYRT
jgi:hypothetical protein